MKRNNVFPIDIEVKQNYITQVPNQVDKRDSTAPICGAAVHICTRVYANTKSARPLSRHCLFLEMQEQDK